MKRSRVMVAIGLLLIGGLFFYGWSTHTETRPVLQAYIPNAGDGTITVVDASGTQVLDTIKVGQTASHGLAVTPDNKRIYTGNLDDGPVFAVSTETREIVAELTIGERAHGIDISPDGQYVLVSAGRDGGPFIAVIATETDRVVAEITEGLASPTHIDFSHDGKRAYVADPGANGVVVIDTAAWNAMRVIQTGNGAQETEVSPDGKHLYVVNYGDQTLSVVDTASLEVVRTVATGKQPHAIAVSPDSRWVWVTNHGSGDIMVFDAKHGYSVVRILKFTKPNHITYHPDGETVYLTDLEDNVLRLIDTRSFEVKQELPLGTSPHEIDLVRVTGN